MKMFKIRTQILSYSTPRTDGNPSIHYIKSPPPKTSSTLSTSFWTGHHLPPKSSTTCTTFLVSNLPSGTSMRRQASQKKSTWLKAICNGSLLTWPLITVKNVNKFFPESDETKQEHMQSQRQVVRSTKPKINEKPQVFRKGLPDLWAFN